MIADNVIKKVSFFPFFRFFDFIFFFQQLFPEGDTAKWLGVSKRPRTAGATFKESMATMIQILSVKVTHVHWT